MGHGSRTRQALKPEPIAEPETEAQADGIKTCTKSSTHPKAHPNGQTNGHASKPTEDSELPVQGTADADDAETNAHGVESDERRTVTAKELEQLAVEFTSMIPPGELSPAEIQGFLLKRKKQPWKAVAEVKAWADAMVEQKASKKKILQVQ